MKQTMSDQKLFFKEWERFIELSTFNDLDDETKNKIKGLFYSGGIGLVSILLDMPFNKWGYVVASLNDELQDFAKDTLNKGDNNNVS